MKPYKKMTALRSHPFWTGLSIYSDFLCCQAIESHRGSATGQVCDHFLLNTDQRAQRSSHYNLSLSYTASQTSNQTNKSCLIF